MAARTEKGGVDNRLEKNENSPSVTQRQPSGFSVFYVFFHEIKKKGEIMKLATALSRRAALQVKISELSRRLESNAKVQEGQQPAENPADLLKELDESCGELEDLIAYINQTNSQTVVEGQSLTRLLARRDAQKLRLGALRGFLSEASNKVTRYSNSEILIHSTVDVQEQQKQVDDLSKELRLLDEKIQETNWTTELIEQ